MDKNKQLKKQSKWKPKKLVGVKTSEPTKVAKVIHLHEDCELQSRKIEYGYLDHWDDAREAAMHDIDDSDW
jgi:hypothetical protein